jgi:hypothetical protein
MQALGDKQFEVLIYGNANYNPSFCIKPEPNVAHHPTTTSQSFFERTLVERTQVCAFVIAGCKFYYAVFLDGYVSHQER